jgi:hypothetical protein
LPFGKYRGISIGVLAETERGRNYLQWVSENVVGSCATAASIALGHLEVANDEEGAG